MSRIIYTHRKQISQIRKQPRRRKLLPTLISMAVLLALAGLVLLLRLPQVQINTIELSGLKNLSEAEIQTALGKELEGNYLLLIPKDFFLLPRTDELSEKLKKEFLQIRSVTIQKEFPNQLNVSIKERELFGIFCPKNYTKEEETDSSECAFVDTSGFAYEKAPHSSGSLILKISKNIEKVEIGMQALKPDLMADLKLIKDELEKLGFSVTSYQLLAELPQEVRIQTSHGFWLWFDRKADLANAVSVLKTLLDQEIKDRLSQLKYIDLRFGNKVFYKFK